jgi:hypothetical protein
MRLALVVVLVACGAEKKPQGTKDCGTFAKRVGEQMAIGAERKNPLAPYVRAEYVASFAKSMEPLCHDKLPAAHVACVTASATAQDADKCPLDLDASVKQAFLEEMQRIVLSALEDSMTVPATAAECATAAEEIAKQLAEGAAGRMPMPDGAAVARLCEKDKWDAAYVRCFNDKHDSNICRSQPIVQAGIKDLINSQR